MDQHNGASVSAATILCDRYWPDAHGGLERKMYNQSRAMARCGVSVHVITENRIGAPKHETIEPNLSVQRIVPMQCGRLWRCRSLVRVWWWYRIIRTKVGAGSIWVSDPRAAVAAVMAGRRGDLVYQPIGCQVAMNRLWQARRGVDTMRTTGVMRWLDRLAYRLAPRIIFESQNVREQFKQSYGPRHSVCDVHNGVEPAPSTSVEARSEALRSLGLKDQHWVVGFVGRLDPCKGLEFLFEAIASDVIDEDICLLLVGDGPDRARLDAMATQLGLTDRIIWAGRLDDLTQTFAAMDVFVLPSVYEAFGNVLMEAMAAGVPVMGRRRDDDPERPVLTANEELILQGQTGLLVDPHDPQDLARQLMVLRLFPGARDAMSRRSRACAASRPWGAVVREYLQVAHQPAEKWAARAA